MTESKFTKVMLDFETFGTSKNACVIQVGACYFNESGEIGPTFKMNIDAEDAQANGANIDASTVYWWLKQSQEARNSIGTNTARHPEKFTFDHLNDFLRHAEEIWSHATFDFVILTEALKRLKIKPSFSYRVSRDIRTLLALANYNKKLTRIGIHHDALDDCAYQVAYVVDAMKELRK